MRISSAAMGNAIFIACQINEQCIDALVDSGAAVTLIQTDVFKRIRRGDTTLVKTHQPILGANNNPLSICGVTEIDIDIGNTKIRQTAYVCEDLSQQLLLGADFLNNNNCIVNFERKTITIGSSVYPMKAAPTQRVCHVAVATSVNVLARSMVNILCKAGFLLANFFARSEFAVV